MNSQNDGNSVLKALRPGIWGYSPIRRVSYADSNCRALNLLK